MKKMDINSNSPNSDYEFTIKTLNENHNLSLFNCSSPELNDFLKNDALMYQTNFLAQTYLCFYKNEPAGFVTIMTDIIEAKSIHTIDKISSFRYGKYPAIKIARLGVDSRFERRGVGSYLLFSVSILVFSLCKHVGCRYILVDSKNESTSFYEKYGFKIAEKNRKSDYTPMYLNIQPIITKRDLQENG
jgi:ribosomal protein S18 acetylase RimI-like enzyme